MGKILKQPKLTTFAEGVILVVGLAIILGAVYMFAPGLRTSGSKVLDSLTVNKDKIDNVSKTEERELPSTSPSTKVTDVPLIRIAEYAWNGNSGCIVANGGPKTTEGSIMESLGVNLEIVRQDQVSELRNMLLKFTEEFDGGATGPVSEKSAVGVSIMGDGVPFFISTTQEALDSKFGKGKYHVQNIGAIGLSNGEDKLIGPRIWKDNPQSMKGSVISSVIGDGDWVLAVNCAFLNKVHVNTDVTTYDPESINFVPSKDDDYINSVKELIASQLNGATIPLKEVKDGKLTGKTVNRKIDGATTWSPGDQLAFKELTGFTDVISTKELSNQMATSIITIKEYALRNEKLFVNLLKGSYLGGDQIKQYDSWAKKASDCVQKTYLFEDADYWYKMFKGYNGTKNGLGYNIGGSKVFNYSDASQYFGITDGVNRYKSVYDQVSKYLVELNPGGFNSTCKEGVVAYDDAVNLYFLKSINDIASTKVEKVDYSKDKTTVLASGDWDITFSTGSVNINGSSTNDLETIYNLLIQAEDTKLSVIGHTDNKVNPTYNLVLSKGRANSVVNYLIDKGIPKNRFQLIDGKGDTEPVGDNSTEIGRSKNRIVKITLLK